MLIACGHALTGVWWAGALGCRAASRGMRMQNLFLRWVFAIRKAKDESHMLYELSLACHHRTRHHLSPSHPTQCHPTPCHPARSSLCYHTAQTVSVCPVAAAEAAEAAAAAEVAGHASAGQVGCPFTIPGAGEEEGHGQHPQPLHHPTIFRTATTDILPLIPER